jgi:8-oxo-dGTP diphosphatase
MHQHTHVGVYASITAEEHILLIHKARGPYSGSWDLPGGGIAFGEEPIETLRREVAEETGLHIETVLLHTVLSHRVRYTTPTGEEDLHHLAILYSLVLPKKQAVRTEPDGEDSLEARWFPLPALSHLSLSPLVLALREHLAHSIQEPLSS